MNTEQEEAKHTLPEKIGAVNYAGFFDFSENGMYDASVINAMDYPNAEQIADEIARRYNEFLSIKSQLQQLQEENKNLKVDCESYKLTIDLELQEVKRLQEENERMKKQIIPETARQFKINSLESEVKTLREALNNIEELEIYGEGFLKAKYVYKIINSALQSKGGEQ